MIGEKNYKKDKWHAGVGWKQQEKSYEAENPRNMMRAK